MKDLQAKLDKLNVLDQINERLIRIENDISTVKGKVDQLEDGLNYTNSKLAEMKGKLEEKAEKDKLKDLERDIEDLRNRSRRNNLVFYNIPEKAEGQDCAAFIKEFINTHMGLEALCGGVEIERAHRTPTKVPGNNSKKPRPVYVAFLRYTDKVKILSNAAARLKDNPNLLPKRTTESDCKQLKALLRHENLTQLINQPTRITQDSKTLLDIIITNSPHNIRESGVLSLSLSDHDMVFCIRKLNWMKAPPETKIFRNYAKYDPAKFCEDLRGVSWDGDQDSSGTTNVDGFCVDKLWLNFNGGTEN